MANKFLLLGLFFTLHILDVSAQNSSAQQLPKIIPPSPNAASLSKYGEIPVSAYTGVPNISIPLYTITDQDLSVPISLSYHASGIKVSEEASRVGLGWALNAGGMISRTIMGDDDFLSGSFGYHVTSGIQNVSNGPRGHLGSSFNIQRGGTISVNGITNLPNLMDQGYNFQPDVYTFNFLGSTGKFYLKRDLTAVLEKKEKINIRCLDASGSSWEITTADGNKFLFEEYETYTDNLSGGGQPITAKTAWYLTKIISPKGTTITFQYTVLSNYVRPTGSFYESTNPVMLPTYTPSDCARVGDPYPNVATITPGKDYRNVYLDKITFRNGEVKFNYSSDRLDLSNDVKVNDIQVYSKSAKDGSLREIKKLNFRYSYFVGTGGPSFADGTTDLASKRLKLDQVFESDALGNSLPPYRFSYYNADLSQSYNNPSKVSFSRDHWGYYNGKSNTSLIPTYSTNSSDDIVAYYIGIQGTNRDVVPQFAQLFTLYEVQYPTGGKTILEYESNDFDISNSKVNDFSYFSNFPEITSVTLNKMYVSSGSGPISPGIYPISSDISNKVLDISDAYLPLGATTTRVSLSAFFRFSNAQSTCSFPSGTLFFTLTKEDGSIISGPTDLASCLGSSPALATCAPPSNPIGINFKNDYDLVPGRYIWKLNLVSNNLDIQDVSLKLDYKTPKATQEITNSGETLSNADYAGGLRLKRIYDNDGSGSYNLKHYLYHFTDTSGKTRSYGRRMSRPIYTYFDDSWKQYICEILGVGGYVDYRSQHLIRESDSNIPLNGSAGGSVVGYDKVVMLSGETGENGKSVFEYENVPDVIWDYSEMDVVNNTSVRVPRKPPTLGSFSNLSNGNLLRQTDSAKTTGGFVKVRDVINTYSELSPANTSMWYGIEKRNVNIGPNVILADKFRGYVYPTLVETRKQLVSTTVSTLNQFDLTKSITQTTNYAYDNNSHLQLNNSSETLSNGDVKTTEFTYPLSYNDQDADNATIKMKELYMHSFPITKRVVLTKASGGTSVVTSAEITKYQLINDKVLPKEIAVLESSQPVSAPQMQNYLPVSGNYPTSFQAKVVFEGYDDAGNLTQFKKPQDISRSYLFDYNNQFPIAEVTNASQNSIAFTSFESNGNGNWAFDNAGVLPGLAITGSKYFQISSTYSVSKSGLVSGNKYIISYWSKNGSYNITGASVIDTKVGRNVNGWVYYQNVVTATSSTITLSGSGLIDELRLYPVGAQMTSYTYEPLIGLTSSVDPNGEITYYEYDGFNRLRNIKDYQGNILKNFQYNYKNSCGSNCYILPMQNLHGGNTPGYPVGVFNVNGVLLGNATNQSKFDSLWNSNTANQQVGTLSAGADPLHFNITLNAGHSLPGNITGLRYYQFDLAYTSLDAIRNTNGAYVDFGDGTSMKLGTHIRDIDVSLAANTTMNFFPPSDPFNAHDVPYFIHTYPNSNTKTITIYHNDESESSNLDNLGNPASSLMTVSNFRGNFPQYITSLSGSCYQSSTAWSVSSINNWNSINTITGFSLRSGDGINPPRNIGFAQDFMANNKGLLAINTNYSDPTFKISRLKSDWSTYFTQLKALQLSDDHWNREDLTALTQLNAVVIYSSSATIPSTVIDNIINQVSAGAGQYVLNGVINIPSGGPARTSASDAALTQLKSKGWKITVANVLQ